jgi:PEP-CTERM motif
MKKIIVASILGIAASTAMVTSSYGQGQLIFGNYSEGGAISAPVTYASGGLAVGSEFTAQLLYSATGTAGTFTPVVGATASFLATDGDTADGAGLFPAETATVLGYVSGNAFFEIEAYNGSSYANSLITGISSVVELSTLATAANTLPQGSMLSDNTAAIVPLTSFTVASVPEPTTLALAGLGGLASLVAFRRKKA